MGFAEILDATDALPLDEQREISEILQKRVIEARRIEIAQNAKEAMTEYRAGNLKEMSVADIMGEALS